MQTAISSHIISLNKSIIFVIYGEEAIKRKFGLLAEDLNQRTQRATAAAEAMTLELGGNSAVT